MVYLYPWITWIFFNINSFPRVNEFLQILLFFAKQFLQILMKTMVLNVIFLYVPGSTNHTVVVFHFWLESEVVPCRTSRSIKWLINVSTAHDSHSKWLRHDHSFKNRVNQKRDLFGLIKVGLEVKPIQWCFT